MLMLLSSAASNLFLMNRFGFFEAGVTVFSVRFSRRGLSSRTSVSYKKFVKNRKCKAVQGKSFCKTLPDNFSEEHHLHQHFSGLHGL